MRSIAARLVRRTGQQLLAVRHRRTLAATDPGADAAIDAALDWLCRAQDSSRTADGGVARHYGLRDGWGASYPETTGYIVPTLIDQAGRRGRPELLDRARRMLDWLVAIQFPDGGDFHRLRAQ